MQALVSILEKDIIYEINKIWEVLEKKFDVILEHNKPLPHFSYQVAEKYNIDKIQKILLEFELKPFTIYTTGLGIFNSSKKVIYIPVIKNENLYKINNFFYAFTKKIAINPLHLYHPLRWIPHITLAYGNFSDEVLKEILLFFINYKFDWEIKIDNISIIDSFHEDGLIFKKNLT